MKIRIYVLFIFFLLIHQLVFSQFSSIFSTKDIPIVDGCLSDSCWQANDWQKIDNCWIPYGKYIDTNDFNGRFKITWAPETNLLYFAIEVIDNIFVDGYVTGKEPEVYNFDIVEVFIDEDKSGGLHVFDGIEDVEKHWGKNAENAFAYHIYAPFPTEGKITTNCFAGDIAGTSWSDIRRVNYESHIPQFALKREGNKAIWEFSLLVYNDKFIDTLTDNTCARALLFEGKILGLSIAYCDNDHPERNTKARDKFYGSIAVPPAAYNDHWINADYFGTIKLVSR